jgi:hypothetical protein
MLLRFHIRGEERAWEKLRKGFSYRIDAELRARCDVFRLAQSLQQRQLLLEYNLMDLPVNFSSHFSKSFSSISLAAIWTRGMEILVRSLD